MLLAAESNNRIIIIIIIIAATTFICTNGVSHLVGLGCRLLEYIIPATNKHDTWQLPQANSISTYFLFALYVCMLENEANGAFTIFKIEFIDT